MLKRLGKTITNNFSLKILAVILAVVLWVVVINIDDPTTSKTYTTNVVAENTDYITSQNKYYEPLDSSNVVSFRVSAARSVHDELSNADFSATARGNDPCAAQAGVVRLQDDALGFCAGSNF